MSDLDDTCMVELDEVQLDVLESSVVGICRETDALQNGRRAPREKDIRSSLNKVSKKLGIICTFADKLDDMQLDVVASETELFLNAVNELDRQPSKEIREKVQHVVDQLESIQAGGEQDALADLEDLADELNLDEHDRHKLQQAEELALHQAGAAQDLRRMMGQCQFSSAAGPDQAKERSKPRSTGRRASSWLMSCLLGATNALPWKTLLAGATGLLACHHTVERRRRQDGGAPSAVSTRKARKEIRRLKSETKALEKEAVTQLVACERAVFQQKERRWGEALDPFSGGPADCSPDYKYFDGVCSEDSP